MLIMFNSRLHGLVNYLHLIHWRDIIILVGVVIRNSSRIVLRVEVSRRCSGYQGPFQSLFCHLLAFESIFIIQSTLTCIWNAVELV